MFTGTNAIDFAKTFPDNETCYQLLDTIKWKDGYRCRKCGCGQYIKGRTHFHRRCQDCGYDESLTANTLFHDMRMPIKKAFFMLFIIATRIKGMSTAELGRLVGVQQRTGWLFKRKIQVAMQRVGDQLSFFELMMISLNELIEKAERKKRSPGKRTKQRGNRSCLRSAKEIKDNAHTKKDKVYRPVISFINFLGDKRQDWSYPGTANQQLLFRSWLGGIHHKCSELLYHCYCDEFAYRFNRRENKDNIFESLVKDMMRSTPHPYSMLRLRRA